MRSVEERLAVAEAELKKRGVKNTAKMLAESNAHQETIVETTPPTTRKNNGVSDNQPITESGADQAKKQKQSLFESCKRAGMSEAEAKLFAGVEDKDLTEAIARGDNAQDFWEAIKQMKD